MGEDFADVLGDAEVGLFVLLGWVAIDNGDVLALEVVDQACCRIYDQRSSGDNHEVSLRNCGDGLVHYRVVERLLVKDDIGFKHATTFGTAWDPVFGTRIFKSLKVVRFVASHAEVAKD